jgi:uncharacterized membrane protein HdeD (DUF308 family)
VNLSERGLGRRLFYFNVKVVDDAIMTAEIKQSGALRAFHIIVGLIAIAAAIFIIAEPGLGIYTLVLLLSISLLILGFSRLARGLSHRLFTKAHRAIDVIAGVLSLILGFVVLAFPLLGVGTLVFLLAFAAMIYGVTSLVLGALAGQLPKWSRAFLVITGIVSVVFSLVVLVFPAFGLFTLVVMLAVSFLVNGVESIISAL